MENHSFPSQKKGLSTGAKIGIGCGGVALLIVIGMIIAGVMFGGKVKQFAEDATKNPTRTTATMMVSASMGAMELVAEDDANKRYTVKETKTGALTTIYWSEKMKSAQVISGDFTAIPSETGTVAPPSPTQAPVSSPAPAP